MKPETISTILKLLNNEVSKREAIMMMAINNEHNRDIENLIKDYQEVYKTRNDFRDWIDEQEKDDG